MKTSDKRTTAELLIATIEAAIARGCKPYSESGELLVTTLEPTGRLPVLLPVAPDAPECFGACVARCFLFPQLRLSSHACATR
jgi:hypothetical protein